MSYNNYVDADAAVRAAYDHGDQPTVAVIKHANPCGIAVGADIADAHRKAHECDPVSRLRRHHRHQPPGHRRRWPAPSPTSSPRSSSRPAFDADALEVLTRRRTSGCSSARPRAAPAPRSARSAAACSCSTATPWTPSSRARTARSTGGDDAASWRLVSGEPADDATLADLQFAWRAVRAVKSNAILLARDGASVGIGMGQVNRVDSCHLAVSPRR